MTLLEGTNLHGATSDRRKQWQEEYEIMKKTIDEEEISW